jgi:hypothetical protein
LGNARRKALVERSDDNTGTPMEECQGRTRTALTGVLSSIFGNEEFRSTLQSFPEGAFTSYLPLRPPLSRLYHAVGLVTNITLGDGVVVDYSQDRIAQGSLDDKIGHG